MFKSIVCAAVLAMPAAEVLGADWVALSTPNQPIVAAGFRHDDGGSLTVLCNTNEKLIRIIHTEPRANWTEGATVNETTMDDSGISTTSKYGKTISRTQMILLNESTFDLLRMGEAKRFFTVTTGGSYARIYPTANFKRMTEPVMKACGDSWQ